MNRDQLEEKLVARVGLVLKRDIEDRGTASLLVSGGSTPVGFFQKLSQFGLPWEKVFISLVDERYLPNDHQDQNGTMVKSILLQNKAQAANFVPMVLDDNSLQHNLDLFKAAVQVLKRPFTCVVLGMGTDGHTASLFPDSDQLQSGMDLNSNLQVIPATSASLPYQRITHTRPSLLQSKSLILHCYGMEKKKILEAAQSNLDWRQYPIAGFIEQTEPELEIFWTE